MLVTPTEGETKKLKIENNKSGIAPVENQCVKVGW